MKRRHAHAIIDEVNADQDRRIASRLRRDSSVLQVAERNLRRWMKRDGKNPRPAFVEWQRILERLTPAEIASFITSETPMARRLRQSSPFAGVLNEAELKMIRQRHAKN